MLQLHTLKYTLPVVMLVLVIMPIGVFAETGLISNEEINLAYDKSTCSFRYWYSGRTYKQTLQFINMREYASDDRSLHAVMFDEAKVDDWSLTEESQSVLYDFNDYRGSQRCHLKVNVILKFNTIELSLTIIRWDTDGADSILKFTYIENGQQSEIVIANNYYFMRITVPSTDIIDRSQLFSFDVLNLALNVGNSVLLCIIGLLSILTLLQTIRIHNRKKGKCK